MPPQSAERSPISGSTLPPQILAACTPARKGGLPPPRASADAEGWTARTSTQPEPGAPAQRTSSPTRPPLEWQRTSDLMRSSSSRVHLLRTALSGKS
jgi:hypothetical protein